jgi:hypothetical protein
MTNNLRDIGEIAASKEKIVAHVIAHSADGPVPTEPWMSQPDVRALIRDGELAAEIRSVDGRRRRFLSPPEAAVSPRVAAALARARAFLAASKPETPPTAIEPAPPEDAPAVDVSAQDDVRAVETDDRTAAELPVVVYARASHRRNGLWGINYKRSDALDERSSVLGTEYADYPTARAAAQSEGMIVVAHFDGARAREAKRRGSVK